MMDGKDWANHVVQTEALARTRGFRRIRDRILALAQVRTEDAVVDIGAGTGLLSLAAAPAVSKVWAVDVAPAMTDYLRTKAASAGLENIETVTASAISLPLVDNVANIVVSNYCLHHLSDPDKERALEEAFRVLRPAGRIVVADMMFRVQMTDERNRRVIASKVMAMLKRGPKGVLRLIKNLTRYITRRWEQPADGEWWQAAFERAGFEQVELHLLRHEGGIITARRPARSSPGRGQIAGGKPTPRSRPERSHSLT
jgi:ubiquinone/menaquinone biosynthesis C-methylase UbiE